MINKRFRKYYKGIEKQPWLVADRTHRMAGHYVWSGLCASLATIVDSLVAGWCIGDEALAAISAIGPLLAIDQILHCLLGFGIEKIMILYRGEGKREEADRAFGSILIAVFAAYLIVFIPIIIFERPILSLFIQDSDLIDMAISYSVPQMIFYPIFEVCLCIERAFRIDGRVALLSGRSIVMNLCNILFDYLLASAFGLWIVGLAWASVISAAIGFCLPLSHFFYKKRTVRPDLSVIRAPREMAGYLKKEIQIGSSATLEEVLESVVVTTQTAVISGLGGVTGLAIFSVYKTLKSVINAISNGISASVSVYSGLLFGIKSYKSIKDSLKTGLGYAASLCALFVAGFMIFAKPLGEAFNIETSQLALCGTCIRIGSIAFPGLMFSIILEAYLPTIGRNLMANVLVFIQKGLMFLAAVAGYILSLTWFYGLYAAAALIAAAVIVVLLIRDKNWFTPKDNLEMIAEYSLAVLPEYISEVSKDIEVRLKEHAYGDKVAARTSLVVEESLSLMREKNPDQEVVADVELQKHEQGIALRLLDDGILQNPVNDIKALSHPDPEHSEIIIVNELTATGQYDRVLDMNNVVLIIETSFPEEPAARAAEQLAQGGKDGHF